LATTAAFAQKDTTVPKPVPTPSMMSNTVIKKSVKEPVAKPAPKDWSKVSLVNRANDHLMVQLAYEAWAGKPDTIHTTGFARTFNIYFLFDFPFKTDPRLSIATGLGFGVDNMFFNKMTPTVNSISNQTLAFPDQSGGNHYKKNKLVTTYLEAPVELRFATDPEHTNSCWKFAAGVKIGEMLSAYTKGKTLQSNADQTIQSGIEKESSKKYFNTTRLVGTLRVSKGFIGVFGQIQATPLIHNGEGPSIFPFSIGVTLSGL
jgi:hypothetical protein